MMSGVDCDFLRLATKFAGFEERREQLTVRPLDSFSFEQRVALMKIDVEFMELQAYDFHVLK